MGLWAEGKRGGGGRESPAKWCRAGRWQKAARETDLIRAAFLGDLARVPGYWWGGRFQGHMTPQDHESLHQPCSHKGPHTRPGSWSGHSPPSDCHPAGSVPPPGDAIQPSTDHTCSRHITRACPVRITLPACRMHVHPDSLHTLLRALSHLLLHRFLAVMPVVCRVSLPHLHPLTPGH